MADAGTAKDINLLGDDWVGPLEEVAGDTFTIHSLIF